MATGIRQLNFSEALKKDLNVEDEAQKIEKEGKILLEKIKKLKVAIPSDRDYLKDMLEDISQTVIRILDLGNEDRKAKQDEINVLKIRVSTLEKKVEKLQESVGAIDAGEAMKIMGSHLAAFVLPSSEKIGDVAPLDDMIRYIQTDKDAQQKWEMLQQQCGMKWEKDHKKITKNWILYRNKRAHQNKFDLSQLRRVMGEGMPRQIQYCTDIVNLFEKVNSLMRLGVIASDLVLRKVIKRKYSKAHAELLNMIMKNFYRDVQHLQDIKITEAKEHLLPYIHKRDIPLWAQLEAEILNTNRLRLGKLAKDKEMQIVWKIAKDPTIMTFDEMSRPKWTKGKISRKHAEKEEQWNKLTDGKEWTKNHSEAMAKLKELRPEHHSKPVEDLPLNIAQLHIPDFLDKRLWMAGSDILEIFNRWEKERRKI